MRDKAIYEYAVLRIVPKVEREEFFNIGVIVFCKGKKFLNMKFNINDKKMLAFDCELDSSSLNEYLHSWELICQGGAAAGRIGEMEMASRFRWLVAARSTLIQSSMTHSGLCEDPGKILDELFEKYVM